MVSLKNYNESQLKQNKLHPDMMPRMTISEWWFPEIAEE